jgi:hypothetical protein
MRAAPRLTDLDNEKFVDLVIYAWACWTGRSALNLNPTSAGNLMGVVSAPEEARYELPLSDDQFLLVDRRYSELAKQHRRVIEVEYFKGGFTDRDLKRHRITRYEWRLRTRTAKLAMYDSLLPEIEDWRP